MACLLVDLGYRFYREWRSYVVGAITTLALAFSLIDLLLNGNPVAVQPISSSSASFYSLDRLGSFAVLAVLVIGLAVSIYSCRYLSKGRKAGPFFALLLLLITSIIGVISAGDLLTLFLFWEGMSIAAYGLVAFYREVAISLEAALKYFFLAGTGSLLALFGISVVYSMTGSILLGSLGELLINGSQLGLFGFLLLVLGFGVEAAIFPLHTWLPDAHAVAPTPVSAVLSGVVIETGIFTIVKLVQPVIYAPISFFGVPSLPAFTSTLQGSFTLLAVLTMFIGNFGALAQSNLKRLLAFSSVAQMGYLLAGISTMTAFGLVAVLFHIWNHGLAKSSFFLLTGSGGKGYESFELEEMKGLGQRHRFLGLMFAGNSLAMVGSPPFGMFWSELLILQSLIAASSTISLALAVAMILNIVLSIVYYFRVINIIALTPNQSETTKPDVWNLFAPIALLILSIMTGLVPWLVLGRIA